MQQDWENPGRTKHFHLPISIQLIDIILDIYIRSGFLTSGQGKENGTHYSSCDFHNSPLIGQVLVTPNSNFQVCLAQGQNLQPVQSDIGNWAYTRINPKEVSSAFPPLLAALKKEVAIKTALQGSSKILHQPFLRCSPQGHQGAFTSSAFTKGPTGTAWP